MKAQIKCSYVLNSFKYIWFIWNLSVWLQRPDYMPEKLKDWSAWTGGAILARLLFSQNQHVTKADYDEAGPSIVHRKCFWNSFLSSKSPFFCLDHLQPFDPLLQIVAFSLGKKNEKTKISWILEFACSKLFLLPKIWNYIIWTTLHYKDHIIWTSQSMSIVHFLA